MSIILIDIAFVYLRSHYYYIQHIFNGIECRMEWGMECRKTILKNSIIKGYILLLFLIYKYENNQYVNR